MALKKDSVSNAVGNIEASGLCLVHVVAILDELNCIKPDTCPFISGIIR